MAAEPMNSLQLLDFMSRVYGHGNSADRLAGNADVLALQEALKELKAGLPRIPADKPSNIQLTRNVMARLENAIQRAIKNLALEQQARSRGPGLFGGQS